MGETGPRRRGGEAVGQAGRRAEEQRAAIDRHDLAVYCLDLPVEAIVGWPGEKAGKPQTAGHIQVADGLQDLLSRGGYVEIARARKS